MYLACQGIKKKNQSVNEDISLLIKKYSPKLHSVPFKKWNTWVLIWTLNIWFDVFLIYKTHRYLNKSLKLNYYIYLLTEIRRQHIPVQSPVQYKSSVYWYDLLRGNTRCNIYVADCTNSTQQILASLEPCVKIKLNFFFFTCQLKPAWFVLFPSYLVLKGLDV